MNGMAYQWKDGARFKGDAQVVGEALDRIRETTSGLTASNVVKAAKPKTSPLHNYFPWNDKEAAQLHREEVARSLIRSITVIISPQEDAQPVRAFVAIGTTEDKYIPTLQVLSQKDLREKMLALALSELRAFESKYKSLQELAPVWRALDRIKVKTAAA
jgi:hypothetical protein